MELSVTPAGAATVDRVDSLNQIFTDGNLQLILPLSFKYSGNYFEIDDPDSGPYTQPMMYL